MLDRVTRTPIFHWTHWRHPLLESLWVFKTDDTREREIWLAKARILDLTEEMNHEAQESGIHR
jgi:hypothetical protein